MRFIIHFLVFMMMTFPFGAQAQEFERYTSLRLMADNTQVQAGETLTVAIEQVIAPGWHTYWKNPGDSGAPSVHGWSVPAGFEVGDIQWPAPEKIPYGPLLNYGYSDQVVMLQDIKVPADYDGSPVTLSVDVDVLVCADVCIPEFETLTLKLNDPSSVSYPVEIAAARSHIPNSREWKSDYRTEDGVFYLSIELPEDIAADGIVDATFIPEEWGLIENAAASDFIVSGNVLTIMQQSGERATSEVEGLPHVLVLSTEEGLSHHGLDATPYVAAASDVSLERFGAESAGSELGAVSSPILFVLFGAFVGGLILNLMPCVFPVLSIKALGLVQIAHGHPEHARAHGLAYTAGVVLSFLLVAGSLMILQFSGAQIGWGFQLQNPVVVTALVYLLFVVGLNFLGTFELTGFSNAGGKLAEKNGLVGAFFTGVLATIVATPCTAPFMATAIGVALTQPPVVGLLVFAVLGLGLAFPYLLLSFAPALHKFLPRPGAWMKTFQQFLAFPMFAGVAWLTWVLAQQIGDVQLFGVLIGLVAIAFGIWLWTHGVKWLAIISFALALFGVPAFSSAPVHVAGDSATAGHEAFGEVFSNDLLNAYLIETDQPIFVEMTAAWCITCKINHAAAINVDATKELFADENVAFLVGDWTNKDEVITVYLREFGRSGVPLYVFYGAPVDGVRPEPVVLPQLLTPGVVEKYVRGTK